MDGESRTDASVRAVRHIGRGRLIPQKDPAARRGAEAYGIGMSKTTKGSEPALDTTGGIAAVRLHRDEQPDGYRVLVDRLWPRGVAKADLDHDEWDKDVAPSNELRKRFHGGDLGFDAFAQEYGGELDDSDAPAALLDRFADSGKDLLVPLYAAKNEEQNHALVLADHLRALAKEKKK